MQQITEKDLSKIAKQISNKVKKGDYVFLEGELGVGKTTFAKYFINHLNHKFKKKIIEVLSPTFNIVQYYKINKKVSIAHYDLYKIKSKKELENIGFFDFEDQFINLVEWPKLLKKNNIDKIKIKLKYTKNGKDRKIYIENFGRFKN
ncbi:MAG: tRNA (adenosine(37)-N6)-threonylcarbamoyltransferase complex ATPase subunit type 1 TsaE [Candidatus Pelagibacter sp.]|nr:tRNA (adenosine(37)-N6)-threonylcarbamoyltransferase complex ATPase subunit type 1 TsaE [Candidatus Pelagibacter sp.]OUV97632.1 MAG: tRNA (adenosine(37)-N6)-threonylcarbamoyltransferase complex ATPase subunit type 1 TsaE [Candidatus Pelagibacter sp. TMED142]